MNRWIQRWVGPKGGTTRRRLLLFTALVAATGFGAGCFDDADAQQSSTEMVGAEWQTEDLIPNDDHIDQSLEGTPRRTLSLLKTYGATEVASIYSARTRLLSTYEGLPSSAKTSNSAVTAAKNIAWKTENSELEKVPPALVSAITSMTTAAHSTSETTNQATKAVNDAETARKADPKSTSQRQIDGLKTTATNATTAMNAVHGLLDNLLRESNLYATLGTSSMRTTLANGLAPLSTSAQLPAHARTHLNAVLSKFSVSAPR